MRQTKKDSLGSTTISTSLGGVTDTNGGTTTTTTTDTSCSHKLSSYLPSRRRLLLRLAAAVRTDGTLASMCTSPCTRRPQPPPHLIPPLTEVSMTERFTTLSQQENSAEFTSDSIPLLTYPLQNHMPLSRSQTLLSRNPLNNNSNICGSPVLLARHSLPRPSISVDSFVSLSTVGHGPSTDLSTVAHGEEDSRVFSPTITKPQPIHADSSQSLTISPYLPLNATFKPKGPVPYTCDEVALPPQLPPIISPTGANPIRKRRLSRSHNLRPYARATFTTSPRYVYTPHTFNPFATAFLQAPSHTLDVFAKLNFDIIPIALPIIRASVLLPFSTVSPHHPPQFVSLVHGTRPSSIAVIIDPNCPRLWHEDFTWRKEVRGTTAIASPCSVLDALPTAPTSGHPYWAPFISSALARMLAVSAGLLQRGHDCLRAIIALQSIREMLRLRAAVRAAMRECVVRGFSRTLVRFSKFGSLSVSPDGWLAHNGSIRTDHALLNPCVWRDERDVARALVTWTNVEIDVNADATMLLRRIRLSLRNVAHWARFALQFSAAHDLEAGVALVGLIRCLFVLRWLPGYNSENKKGINCNGRVFLPVDYNHARDNSEYNDSTDHRMYLCANEFLDHAIANGELERSIPIILNLAGDVTSGHDLDCGPITRDEVCEAARAAGLIKSRGRRRGGWFTGQRGSAGTDDWCTIGGNGATDDDDAIVCTTDDGSRLDCALWTWRSSRRRRVVMSIWTDGLSNTEWCVPSTVAQSVDFRLEGVKYRLSVSKGEIGCRRVGASGWLMRRKGRGRGRGRLAEGTGGAEGGTSDEAEAYGSVAICNALDRVYGDAVCFQVLCWMHRGLIRVSETCLAAMFVPRRYVGGTLVVNRRLPFEVCRRMVFGRKGHSLYWLPGEQLPCFLLKPRENGSSYALIESSNLPRGVELCRADIAKDFG